jgi:3-hydroxyisobutyrate dehydrogenase-like beta-hydroxyacid dehydrogenase
MTQSKLPSIGIVGLGLVGLAIARRLRQRGYPARAFDIDATRRTVAEENDLDWSSSLMELSASSEVIVLCVLDDSALLDCSTRLAEIFDQRCSQSLSKNIETCPKLVLSCVTASQGATRDAAAAITVTRSRDAAFMDLPLLGSSEQILVGTAIGLLGASSHNAQTWAGFLSDVSPRHYHLGAVGQGVAAKLACNLILGLNRSALAEGLALAQALGIAPQQFLSLLKDSPAYSKAVDYAGPKMLKPSKLPASRIRQHRKDIGLIQAATRDAGLHGELIMAQAALLDRAIDLGLGDRDNAAIYEACQRSIPPSPPKTGTS